MMTNLFSIFDPSTTTLPFNWISMTIPTMIIIPQLWLINSRSSSIMNKIMMTLNNEFKIMLNTKKLNSTPLILISMMTFIAINNFMGLFPYIFTATSHIMITLMMALPFWITIMIFGWINHTKSMLAHLVPMGTPTALMSFMVCIETISNIIRPITLSVRLAANMIAGHLLISLLGNYTMNSSYSLIPMMLVMQMMLLTLESAVAIIQSYVFVVLLSLYTAETHH